MGPLVILVGEEEGEGRNLYGGGGEGGVEAAYLHLEAIAGRLAAALNTDDAHEKEEGGEGGTMGVGGGGEERV